MNNIGYSGPINQKDDKDNDVDTEDIEPDNDVSLISYTPTEEDREYQNTYNAVNGGFVARNSSYIFYNKDKTITRMTSDFEDKTAIIKEDCGAIYLIGDRLYFLSNDEGAICSSDMNGRKRKTIVSDDICWFYVDTDHIYYLNNHQDKNGNGYVFRTDLDGKNRIQITDVDTYYFNVSDDFVVYCDSVWKNVYRSDLNGQHKEIIYSAPDNDTINEVHLYKDTIYILFDNYDNMDACGINSLDPETQEINNIIYNTWPCNLMFWNDHLVFSSRDDEVITCCDLSGRDEVSIVSDDTHICTCLGDYLYYYDWGYEDYYEKSLISYKERAFEPLVYYSLVYGNDSLYMGKQYEDGVYQNVLGSQDITRISEEPFWSYIDYNVRYNYEFDYRCEPNKIIIHFPDRPDWVYEEPTAATLTPFEVINGWLYYQYYSEDYSVVSFKRIRIEDNLDEEIETYGDERVYSIDYYNDRLFVKYIDYTDDLSPTESLGSMNLDGSDKKIIYNGSSSLVRLTEDYIFLLVDGTVHRMNHDGSKDVEITNFSCWSFVINEEKEEIYFINRYDNGNIYKSDFDGKNLELYLDFSKYYPSEISEASLSVKETFRVFFFSNYSYDDQVVLADVTHDGNADMIVIHEIDEGQYYGYVYTIKDNQVIEIASKYGATCHAGGFFNWFLTERGGYWYLGEEIFGMWQGLGEERFIDYYYSEEDNYETYYVTTMQCPKDDTEKDADGYVLEEAFNAYHERLAEVKKDYYCLFSSFDEPNAMTINTDPADVFY